MTRTRSGGRRAAGNPAQPARQVPAAIAVVTGLAATDVVGYNGSGNITLTFTKVPRQVTVTDESGNITLVLPRGPTYYHVDTSSESGNTSVSVNHRRSSPYVIIASNGSGNITISY